MVTAKDGGGLGNPAMKGGNRVLLSGSSCLETPAQLALDRTIRSGQPASVLRLYLSRLQLSGPQYRRVARCLFDDAVQQGGGHVFTCGEGDLVLISAPDPVAALGAVLLRLFRAEAPADRQVLGLWSLPTDEAAVRAEFACTSHEASVPEDAPTPIGALAALNALVSSAPPGDIVRRQTAVRIDGRSMTPLFHELSVSYPVLEARLGMRLPIGADPYLFRYIAGQLDGRMLGSLAEADLSQVPALNINVPLACAASPGFSALQAAAKRAGMRLGVELPFVEVIADCRRYAALRDRLQADGCSVVLDGIDHHALLQCDPASLGADLLKLEWSALIQAQSPRDARRLNRAVEAVGANRLVLCRAETETALVWGLGQRITRFQGRHVDAMLAADRITLCKYSDGCSLGQCIERAAATDAAGQVGCFDTALLGGVLHACRSTQPVT